jgi:hypothetical protein
MPATYQASVDFESLAKEYAGRWVAIHPETGAVLAAGASAPEVYEAAVAQGVDCPLVNLIVDDYSIYAP